MIPQTRICNAVLADGTKCQESANVHNISYIYEANENASGVTDKALTEVHYDLQCPKCGRRTHVER
jgi:hypothetical protein